ncbi:50S ribosomal protein L10 [bioreactor metagenome]|uniref:50S ribosomal protein L10 n=1 Tax=bioreactor metagenome TaxID=1076179 RepID=A0A644T637_9ZZZZ|nr:50S ribosomal protein L10 [Candidatus Elulimicrobiales bacterium]
MALSKDKKSELIKKYSGILDKAKTLVYVKFKGLNVKDTEALRKKLFAEGISYNVVKKTLWDRALSDKKIDGEKPEIGEEMAVVAGEDLLAAARIANDFSKEHRGIFSIIGGIFDGVFKDEKSMMEIATIPSREVLISQIAFLFKSPMQRLAIGINEVAKKK